MSSADAWLFPIVSVCVRRLRGMDGIRRRTRRPLTFSFSGRLGRLVWHVRGGHVRGQGMDQLVTRVVFFDRRGGERMEGTTSLCDDERVRADPRGRLGLVYGVVG